jgi:hypothetical protein
VGIGTSIPNTKLHINGVGIENNGSTAVVRIVSGNGVQNLLLDGNEIDATADGLHLNNNSSENLLLVNGGGNVGVGITTPSRKLHIRDAMRLEPRTTLPINESAGDLFTLGNSASSVLCFYTGKLWVAVAPSSATATIVN